jgi:hypothetical protein
MALNDHTTNLHPLQNRVDPFGELIRTTARGAWMGNRGLIHNEHQQIIRPFRLKAWITCRLEFKGRHRMVMSPTYILNFSSSMKRRHFLRATGPVPNW